MFVQERGCLFVEPYCYSLLFLDVDVCVVIRLNIDCALFVSWLINNIRRFCHSFVSVIVG